MSQEEILKDVGKELHRKVVTKFRRRKVISAFPGQIFSADLVDMQAWADENNGYKYILNVIDIYSRYVWSRALKNKTAKSVLDAFKDIVDSAGKAPQHLWVDKGSEFYNKDLKAYAKKKGFNIYSTYGESKAVVVERFNRTLKDAMWTYFDQHNTRKWDDLLDTLVKDYNNHQHGSLQKHSPKQIWDGSKKLDQVVGQIPSSRPKPTFAVGDRVRISRQKGVFEPGYVGNWSREVFIVTQVVPSDPYTFKIKDSLNEPIEGTFYKQELQKTKQPENWGLVENIISTKTVKGKKMHLVKWLGLPKKYNSYISDDDALKLFGKNT